tara:strand:- start:186 stop:344 length:159 start_codon:yes stop_codon:yes gene_type:complete
MEELDHEEFLNLMEDINAEKIEEAKLIIGNLQATDMFDFLNNQTVADKKDIH